MAPGSIEVDVPVARSVGVTPSTKPLKLSGALNDFESFDPTPLTGREFPKANIVDWLRAPNSDALIRDLAITVSQRGVVFFRKQDDLTPELQKELLTRLGELTCRPAASGLHIHPFFNAERDDQGDDHVVSYIHQKQQKPEPLIKSSDLAADALCPKKQNTAEWHSDACFEPVPADYSCLRLTTIPPTGGDTLWANGYELYDKISEPYQKFLETLTVTFEPPGLKQMCDAAGVTLYSKERGNPENVGDVIKAVHPVVRTNPVTGWKSVFAIGGMVKHINRVTSEESKMLVDWFHDLIFKNHTIQVRFNWKDPNDFAIWDNRSFYHSATYDFWQMGDRHGCRGSGVGEKPYLDPKSKSRREDLAANGP
ncbi:Putative TauD/TfdA-like domain, taurine dioxygenase TauD-like superfamily [Colletotrichum destructivum]|uniref:TauD/TfdA-like domain, taurine dioxygenase TauD-like superfamily n=1 Tax=Colletotrichum destructivum TaxID=34406 RepID=A0AAX4I5E2_9PEZI|nr:Putative TauD/TfdA-like domain, taurine dioxygenase TauD-like superfamily [Colletotrichum destructivum]